MRVGHSRQCLTPQNEEFYLLGYKTPKRNEPALGVHDDIFSNALLIEVDGVRTFLWSADLLELPDTIAAALKARLESEFGLNKNRIILSVMHDHSSVRDFHDDWEFGKFSQEYYDFFVESVLRSCRECIDSLKEASAVYGREIITGFYSSRNHEGELADNEVIVIKFVGEDNRPFAALVNWAVHSTAMGANNMYLTGDLAGNTCRKLGELWGYYPMMLNGAAADCSNRNDRQGTDFEELERESSGLCEAIAEIPAETPLHIAAPVYKTGHQTIDTDMQSYKADLAQLITELSDGTRKTPGNMPVDHLIGKCSEQMQLESYHDELETEVLDLGDLRIFIFPGELSSELGRRLKQSSPGKLVLIAGYSNGFHYYFFNREEYGLSFETIGNPVQKGTPEQIIENMIADGNKLSEMSV